MDYCGFDFSKPNKCTNAILNSFFDKEAIFTDDSGVPFDMTGSSFSMSIQAQSTDVDLLTLTATGDAITTGLYIPAPTTGVMNIQITVSDINTIGAGVFDYAITMIDTLSRSMIIMSGEFEVIKSL